MRLSLGVRPVLAPLGAALLLMAALPLTDGNGWLSGVRSAAAQGTPSSQGRRTTKRPVQKAKSKDAGGETERQLDAAAKSLAEGNADAAMTTLDGILSHGGLANKDMARALYLRGLAHRKKARPAQAIADLTSAVWLKGGLSDADRTAALKERSEISREIGVADGGAPPASVATSSPAAAPTASSAPSPAAQTGLIKRPPPVSSPGGLTEGGFPRAMATAPQTATEPAPRAHPPGKSTSSWQSGTSVENSGSAGKPSGGVGEFFSGLFGGGAPASPPPAAKSAAKSADDPSWSTSVRSPSAHHGADKRGQRSAAVATSSTPSHATASGAGKYRLQIAAVRSRKEAEAVAARVKKEHGRVIGGRKLEVDETVFGNMGTFYRVRLGPFAAVQESKAVCDQLRAKGYDCLVVTQ